MNDRPPPRRYFSARAGRGPAGATLTLDQLKKLVESVWNQLLVDDFFQEAVGYVCVDAGVVSGYTQNTQAFLFRALHRENVWPWRHFIEQWDEDTLFDMIEAMHDLASQPTEGFNHNFNDCGFHATAFDQEAGRKRYRDEMNEILSRWEPPYQLDAEGELVLLVPHEFESLVASQLPEAADEVSIRATTEAAITLFRSRGASRQDRLHAVSDLAGVLEALRPEAKKHLTKKDESDLFNIANSFAIRHNDPSQKREYDDLIWLTWIFYVYLATIHALTRVIERDD